MLQIQANLLVTQTAWCLIGGLAVGARTDPRFTKDLDLAVSTLDDKASEDLVFSLQAQGYRILAILEQQITGRLATVRLAPPGGLDITVIDLLFASSGIENSIVARARPLEVFPQLQVPVAQLGDLIAMKILARDDRNRPQDRLDLRSLFGLATPDDKSIALQALREIIQTGSNRGRALLQEFREAEAEFGDH